MLHALASVPSVGTQKVVVLPFTARMQQFPCSEVSGDPQAVPVCWVVPQRCPCLPPHWLSTFSEAQ